MPKRAEPAKPTHRSQTVAGTKHPHNSPRRLRRSQGWELVTEGVEQRFTRRAQESARQGGCGAEFIAPTIAGVKASDGSLIEANQKIDGGPSVLYDAVALLVSEQGADVLANSRQPAISSPMRLRIRSSSLTPKQRSRFCTNVLGADKLDDGFIEIGGAKDIAKFIQECRKLRFWDRANGHLLSNVAAQ